MGVYKVKLPIRGSVVKGLLIIVPVVVALTLVSLFMPARRVSIEGVGKVSFETTVTLSVGSEVAYAAPDTATNSPTANTGSAWTDPTRAYDDGGTGYASITSGSPSGSNVWGTYGFNLTGSTITQVRVRYDAWSVGNTIANTVTYNTVTKGETSGAVSTLTYAHNVGSQTNKILIVGVAFEGANTSQDVSGVTYNGVAMTKINELVVGTTFIMEASLWYMLDDQLPDDNANHNVVVTFTNNSSNAIESGAISLYNANQAAPTDFGGTGYNNSTDPITRQYTTTADNTMAVDVVGCGNTGGSYTASGQTERWDDNVGSSGLTGAGGTRLVATAGTVTNSWDFSSTVNRQAMHVCGVQSYTYTEYDDQIKVDVSWDGGSNWSSTDNTTLTSAEAITWYDVTGVTTWTPAKLADGQLQVRALAQLVNNAEVVRLDWLPVEVTYTPAVPDISVDPTTYYFGTVTESSTPSTITTYFTITNASTIQTDQTISVTTSSWSGGSGWTHNDSGSPGANAAALLANRGGSWGIGDIIVKYSSPVYIYENCPASTNYSFGLKLLAPTSFSDGAQKQIIVRITAVAG